MKHSATTEQATLKERTLAFNTPSESENSAYDSYTETMKPQAATRPERMLNREKVVFVHKGQARVLLDEDVHTLVPGRTLRVPKGAWFSLKNTGTGELILASVIVPGGLDRFYKEWEALADKDDAGKLGELASRFDCELQLTEDDRLSKPVSKNKRRSDSTRKRGRRSGGKRTDKLQVKADKSEEAPSSEAGSANTAGRARSRKKTSTKSSGAKTAQAKKTTATRRPDSGRSGQRSGGRRPGSRHKAKEVYINGKWVEVDVSKPVIALGENRTQAFRKRARRKQSNKDS